MSLQINIANSLWEDVTAGNKILVPSSSGKARVTLNLKQCLPLEACVNTRPVFIWPSAYKWEANLCTTNSRVCDGTAQGVGSM